MVTELSQTIIQNLQDCKTAEGRHHLGGRSHAQYGRTVRYYNRFA